jgi:hypothetical protein
MDGGHADLVGVCHLQRPRARLGGPRGELVLRIDGGARRPDPATVAACACGGGGAGAGREPGRPGGLGSFPLPPPRSTGGHIWQRWSARRLAPRGGVRRPDLAGGGQIRRWWLRARAVETVGGLAELLGGRGGLDSFPLPLLAAQAVGSRPDGPLDGARLAEAVIVDRGVAWEAKWPRLLPQPPRGGSGHVRQWPRTTASAVVRRPTPWMAKVER